MFSYSTGYYVQRPVDQYLKFKNRCSLFLIYSMTLNPNPSAFPYNAYEENFVFFLSMYCKLELHLVVFARVIPGKAMQACSIHGVMYLAAVLYQCTWHMGQ
jgi:hypothetical protein